MTIIDLPPHDSALITATARLLMVGFRECAPAAWPDLASALEEVHESLASDRISRIKLGADGQVWGWIGGMPHYSGYSWELHPLVVSPEHQRQGIGRQLVADLEAQVRQRGGGTLYLCSDDETGLTTLANRDLYPNPLKCLQQMENLYGHPYCFYQKVGFALVGVIPDASGPGRPDILMAKRVSG